ncbi:hypothetical protein RN001_004843 [Aquatica leii]|uniref:Protein inscuteable homologue C-terminal domain-containing protein n=1 Tax=Aquatica leii TaxID=1421715 RepID=A0AAN7PYZ3_9COLE|nr:hypothetical protein RN001_004843 [Aquatica leii]
MSTLSSCGLHGFNYEQEMGEFQRSPSKVWWQCDYDSWPRNISSPGSQDSGFSDAEILPPNSDPQKRMTQSPQLRDISKDLLKNVSEKDDTKPQNLFTNLKQKCSPKKSMAFLSVSDYKIQTPSRQSQEPIIKTEPIKRHKFHRNGSLKVSRNLFKNLLREPADDTSLRFPYQYAEGRNDYVESQYSNTSSKVTYDDSYIWKSNENSIESYEGVKTYPFLTDTLSFSIQRNKSAPAVVLSTDWNENFILNPHDESLQSSDSELESAFHNLIHKPKQTSTPKFSFRSFRNMRQHRSKRISKLASSAKNDGCQFNVNSQPLSVQKWLQEARDLYEPECTTALQCKSIAAELNQKVALLAARLTTTLRKILADSEMILVEFNNIKDQKQHTGPLAQSVARLVEEFIKTYRTATGTKEILKICEELRCSSSENISKLIIQLSLNWETIQETIVNEEIKNLVCKLEDPESELYVRAIVTGLTSIGLRNKEIVNQLISCNAVQILCVLCEKCESSTVRSLILRALSTVCNNNIAVRKFESYPGIVLIADIISDESRPEPERSEAVALLAQVTAPWIEDNRNVQGLQDQVKVLVKSLTNFIYVTKCCQNLLLCTAALANLTEMEPKTIKYLLHHNSIAIILRAMKSRGTLISVYLLEQVANLLANLSGKSIARNVLIEEETVEVLLYFLQYNCVDKNVELRLQQKSIIALSRLSGNIKAAEQIVKFNGVRRLVTLCRERKERHNSDAVLVASLATLRKVAEACGNDVIDSVDVQELVEPKLLDSFLAYSTQNESYV